MRIEDKLFKSIKRFYKSIKQLANILIFLYATSKNVNNLVLNRLEKMHETLLIFFIN